MKKLDLATLGVEEMSEVQMQEVDGGWLMTALVFQLACEIIDGSFVNDIKRGYKETSCL